MSPRSASKPSLGASPPSIASVSRNGASSGMGSAEVAVPNAYPKSMCTTDPVVVSSRMFCRCRSPTPATQPHIDPAATLAANRDRCAKNASGEPAARSSARRSAGFSRDAAGELAAAARRRRDASAVRASARGVVAIASRKCAAETAPELGAESLAPGVRRRREYAPPSVFLSSSSGCIACALTQCWCLAPTASPGLVRAPSASSRGVVPATYSSSPARRDSGATWNTRACKPRRLDAGSAANNPSIAAKRRSTRSSCRRSSEPFAMKTYSRPSLPRRQIFFGLCLDANTATSGSKPTRSACSSTLGGPAGASYWPGISTPPRNRRTRAAQSAFSFKKTPSFSRVSIFSITPLPSNAANQREKCASASRGRASVAAAPEDERHRSAIVFSASAKLATKALQASNALRGSFLRASLIALPSGPFASCANRRFSAPRCGSSGSPTSHTAASAAPNAASAAAPPAALAAAPATSSLTCARHHARRCAGKSSRVTARANASPAGETSVASTRRAHRAAPTLENSARATRCSAYAADGYVDARDSTTASAASPPGPGVSRSE